MNKRRSFAVLLLGLGLAACTDQPEKQEYRKAYASREACLADNAGNAAACTVVESSDGSGGTSFLGPFVMGYMASSLMNGGVTGYQTRQGFVSRDEVERRERDRPRGAATTSRYVPFFHSNSGSGAGAVSGSGSGSSVHSSPSTASRGFFGGTGRAMGGSFS
jgi:hypothetical protein